MGILQQFKNREEARITKFFEYADRFTAEEIELALSDAFEAFMSQGYIGKLVLDSLKSKIAAVCNMTVTARSTNQDFINEFSKLDDSTKRCLLVTILNDVCKLGVTHEGQAYLFLEDRLRKAPRAGGALNPAANNNTNKEG